VRFAFDHGTPKKLQRQGSMAKVMEGTANAPKVALKFMCNVDQFSCELKTHQSAAFDDTLVIGVIDSFNGDDDEAFREDAAWKGFGEYPYCLVMKGAEGNYQRVVQQQHIAGENWDAIKYALKELVHCLQHVHGKGYMHGDLKPMNMLVVNRDVLLTDFDASATIGEGYAGE
jgi:serine/threonine protein kinase